MVAAMAMAAVVTVVEETEKPWWPLALGVYSMYVHGTFRIGCRSSKREGFIFMTQQDMTGRNETHMRAGHTTNEPEQEQRQEPELEQTLEAGFRPLTRIERRNLWLKEYGEQDFALQMWARLIEIHDLEIEMMLQMKGLLVFGLMVKTAHYAQFYIDLNEELHREEDPDTADALKEYYAALVPISDQVEMGPEGLPTMYRYVHMRDVTIMNAGHKVKVPYWRGKISEVDGFVIGATAGE